MLSIITSVLFFAAVIIQFARGYKVNKLQKRLRQRRVELFPWTRFSALRAYKKIVNETRDKEVKNTAIKILRLIHIANIVWFGSFIIIFLLIALNGIFKWNL